MTRKIRLNVLAGYPTCQFRPADTLVVLNPSGDFWAEFERISPIASRVSLKYDVVISAIPVDRAEFLHAKSPLLLNVRREGVAVA